MIKYIYLSRTIYCQSRGTTVTPFSWKSLISVSLILESVIRWEISFISPLEKLCINVCSEYPTMVKMVGIKDTFGESGTPDELMEKYNLTSKAIIEEVKAILK